MRLGEWESKPDEVVAPDSDVIDFSDDELIEAILIPKIGILRQPVIPFLHKANTERTTNIYGASTEYLTSHPMMDVKRLS